MKSRNPDGDLHEQIVAMVGEGRSQAQAAKALGVSASTVSRVLTDRRSDGEHRAAQDAVDVFVRSLGPELGAPIHPQVLAATFMRHREAAGIPTGTLRVLRHTAATIALTRGVPLHVVARCGAR